MLTFKKVSYSEPFRHLEEGCTSCKNASAKHKDDERPARGVVLRKRTLQRSFLSDLIANSGCRERLSFMYLSNFNLT